MQKSIDDFTTEAVPFEDKLFENEIGIPDISWVSGLGCSELFEQLTPLERKLLVKYYLEDYNDRQVAEGMGMHINTVNARRRSAAEHIRNRQISDKEKQKEW